MIDTNEKMKQIYDAMFVRLSPEERAYMGCSMHDFSKEIVLNQIVSCEKSHAQVMEELFLRFYKVDFGERYLDGALRAIRSHHFVGLQKVDARVTAAFRRCPEFR